MNRAANWIYTIMVLTIGLYALTEIVQALPDFGYGGIILAATAGAIVLFIKQGVRR